MALAPGLETYPRAFLKPWPAIVVTISLAIFKFFYNPALHRLSQDWGSPDGAVSTYTVVLGLGAVVFKTHAGTRANRTVRTELEGSHTLGCSECPWTYLCKGSLGNSDVPRSCRTDKIFLGQRGERIEEFSSPQFAASLSNSEKSMLLKALVVGAYSAPSPRFKQWLTSFIGLTSAKRETRDS